MNKRSFVSDARVTLCALVLAACSSAQPQVDHAATRSIRRLSSAERAWVERTLATLSVREKAGQLVMPWVGGEYSAVDSEAFDSVSTWVSDEAVGGLVVSVGLPHS